MFIKRLLLALAAILAIAPAAASSVAFNRMWLERDTTVRESIQDAMQSRIDTTPKKEFDDFDENPECATGNPVLQFYDQSLARLVREIPATTVKPGTAVIWYLYNMGFVIKTPTACFGVDIHHRHAVELAPLLDFVAITHNHGDHYSMPLLHAMSAAKKPVISNFFPNFAYTKATSYTHTFNGVTIHCGEADHNPVLKKFTMPMEFICPTGDREFVFFTSGDCRTHEELYRKSARINLYAIHPRNHMTPVKAAEKLEPELTILAHLQEMGHEVNMYRWKFSDGRYEVNEFNKIGKKAYVPVWGEKFLWDGEKIHVCHE